MLYVVPVTYTLPEVSMARLSIVSYPDPPKNVEYISDSPELSNFAMKPS